MPPLMTMNTMKRSHSEVDLVMEDSSYGSRSTLRKSASHSMLLEKSREWDGAEAQTKLARK